MGSDGTGQGRPRSPCPYKYCPERMIQGGGTKKKKEDNEGEKKRKGDRERETDSFLERKERPKERNNNFSREKRVKRKGPKW